MDPIARATTRLEGARRLDALDRVMRPIADRLASGRSGEVLGGRWLGHALHPLLTDLPLGCWMSAGLLDLVGGPSARPAARRLVALGLLATPPTAAAGFVEYAGTTQRRSRRVAAVHGIGNLMVAWCYLESWKARRRGHHVRGVIAGLAGGTLAWGTGYLGGHLSFGRGVGVGARGSMPRSTDSTETDVDVIDADVTDGDVTDADVADVVTGGAAAGEAGTRPGYSAA